MPQLCDCLSYIVSSKPASTIYQDPVSVIQKNQINKYNCSHSYILHASWSNRHVSHFLGIPQILPNPCPLPKLPTGLSSLLPRQDLPGRGRGAAHRFFKNLPTPPKLKQLEAQQQPSCPWSMKVFSVGHRLTKAGRASHAGPGGGLQHLSSSSGARYMVTYTCGSIQVWPQDPEGS